MHKTATGVEEMAKDSAEPPQISDGFFQHMACQLVARFG
jgi:hypothetical protein